ncbi:hypothetical protein C12CBH8_04510 [Solibaculum mannosilyticum]|uniref:Uncharacterized protein n=1 Tax=Solibaculum mannosilyticum TaxID=2780922 RepID=A0A7I8D278_9FIRM|nr:hypothetical protein C12CBH8_04510 [Solibaculum mannosilyticum]
MEARCRLWKLLACETGVKSALPKEPIPHLRSNSPVASSKDGSITHWRRKLFSGLFPLISTPFELSLAATIIAQSCRLNILKILLIYFPHKKSPVQKGRGFFLFITPQTRNGTYNNSTSPHQKYPDWLQPLQSLSQSRGIPQSRGSSPQWPYRFGCLWPLR